jgi:hypothetical protein
MKTRKLMLVAVPFLAAGLLAKPVIGQEEVDAIYRAVLEPYAAAGQVVVRTGLRWSDEEEFVRRTLPGLDESLVRAYADAIRSGEPRLEGRDLGIAIEWLSPERIEALGRSGDPQQFWPNFRAAYPDANRILSVSPVGLSADRREALLALAQGSGPRSCSVALLHLSRGTSGWRISRQAIYEMC